MSCLPHGHPRMWLGAEDSRIPDHHCWASRGGQSEEAEWLGPSLRARGLGLEIPALAFSPPSASVRPVGDPGWSLPCLCVSLPSSTLHVLSVWAFLSAPALPLPSAPAMPSASLSCPTPTPCHFSCICFSVPSASLSSSLCSLCSIRQLFHVAKEKKKGGGRDRNTKKAQTKTNLECVTKCCVLLVASVCPCGLQPARPPHPSAVCPARLPALPLLPTTRSSVPGCLVMVPDV